MTDTQWVAAVVVVGVVVLVVWAWGMTRLDERYEREAQVQRAEMKRGGPPVPDGRSEPRHARRARRP